MEGTARRSNLRDIPQIKRQNSINIQSILVRASSDSEGHGERTWQNLTLQIHAPPGARI